MPSITQWSALGGLGTAAGQSLQEILAHRLAEQRRLDLQAEAEAEREQQRQAAEALAQYRQDTLAQDESQFGRTYEQTERTRAEGAPLRLLNVDKARADLATTTAKTKRQEDAIAAMKDPSFLTRPRAERQLIFAEATGGQTPSAGMLETEAERRARLEQEEGPSSPKTRSQIAVEEAREKNRPPSPDPNTPPKPSDAEQALPAELSGFLSDLEAVAPNLQAARRAIIKNRAAIQRRFPTAKFNVIDEALQQFYGGAVQSGASKGVGTAPGRPLNPFSSYTPDPEWVLPEGPVVKDPGAGAGAGAVTPPAVDPAWEAYQNELRKRFPQ